MGRRAARAPGRTRRARLQAQTVRRRLDAAAIGAEATVDVDRVDALDRPRRHGLRVNVLLPARSARTGPRSRLPAMCWIMGVSGGANGPETRFFSGRACSSACNRRKRCWRAGSRLSRVANRREGDATTLSGVRHSYTGGRRERWRCLCPSQRVVPPPGLPLDRAFSRRRAPPWARCSVEGSCVFFSRDACLDVRWLGAIAFGSRCMLLTWCGLMIFGAARCFSERKTLTPKRRRRERAQRRRFLGEGLRGQAQAQAVGVSASSPSRARHR